MRRPGPALIAADLLRLACAVGVLAYRLGTQAWRNPSPYAAAALAGIVRPSRRARTAARDAGPGRR